MRLTFILERHLGYILDWFSLKSYPAQPIIRMLIEDLEEEKLHTPDDYGILHCLSDAYFIARDYEKSVNNCPLPEYKQKWYLLANRRLNLKVLANHRCTARDILPLFSKRITNYGLERIDVIAEIFDSLLSDWEEDAGESIISYLVRKYPEKRIQPHYLFNGTPYSKMALDGMQFYSFYDIPEFEAIVYQLTRKGENILRESEGLPRVGEGWISETKLYREIKAILSDMEVVHHASMPWLRRQHLDIYVPTLSLAFEYQGRQHDVPVAYFGGQEAFEKQMRRDRAKSNLCKRHGVKIIYIREGYDINSIKTDIDAHIQRSDLRT